jgi:O-antigen ligase
LSPPGLVIAPPILTAPRWRAKSPSLLLLNAVMILFVIGTTSFVGRDPFHQDDSTVQPFIEVSCVVLGTVLAVGAAIHHRVSITPQWPYVLLFLTLTLAVVFSVRSWEPLMSAAHGALRLLISVSTLALLQIYGIRRLLYSVMNAYLFLIALGVIVGLAYPNDLPLLVRDPGQDAFRTRLHLFSIHPIALADDCVICLIFSALYAGREVRLRRSVLAGCLLLTMTRASIILGAPMYLVAELVSRTNVASGARRTKVALGLLVFLPALAGLCVMYAYSDWGPMEQFRSTISQMFEANHDTSTLNGRTPLWTMLIDDLSLQNMYGYGIGGARYYLRTVNPWYGQAHNSVLETVYTVGYFGTALILVALAGAFYRFFSCRRDPDSRVLMILLLYVFAAGMMNPSWYETSSVIAISVACAGLTVSRRSPEALHPFRDLALMT